MFENQALLPFLILLIDASSSYPCVLLRNASKENDLM